MVKIPTPAFNQTKCGGLFMRSQAVTIAMQVLEKPVVVFSQKYLPLCWVNIKRAIVLLVTEQFWIDVQANLELQESIRNAEINIHRIEL